MSDTLARAGWTVFAVALGGAVATAGWLPLIVVALVLGVAAGASKSRWLQERIPLLTTDKQRLRRFYDSAYDDLRAEFMRQKKSGTWESWDAWADRLRRWDEPFLKYLQQRDDWRPLWRTQLSPLTKGFSNWQEITKKSIDGRLDLIDRLLKE